MVAGHSFGGATAIESTIQEPRFTGCIALDAWMLPVSKVWCEFLPMRRQLKQCGNVTNPLDWAAALVYKVHSNPSPCPLTPHVLN